MTWYHVAEPNSYLVVTGVGIEKVKIQKKVRFLPVEQSDLRMLTAFRPSCTRFKKSPKSVSHLSISPCLCKP
jgi:hypothetical protein